MKDLVAIAKIVRPRGLRGELLADILTDFPARFENLANVTAVTPSGETLELKIEDFWFQKGRVVLRFAGYDTIETADTLRGSEVCVAESEAVELGEDEYYDWQLEGCRVETIEGAAVGTVTGVMRTGGTELLVVNDGGRERLIPFVAAICVGVDIENRSIRVDPPEGLLEF